MGCIDTNFCLSDTDPEVLACLFADHAEIVCKIGIHPIADGNLCCHNPSLFPHHRYRIIRTLGLLASLLAILCMYFHSSLVQFTKSKHQYRSFSLFPLQTNINPLVKVVISSLFLLNVRRNLFAIPPIVSFHAVYRTQKSVYWTSAFIRITEKDHQTLKHQRQVVHFSLSTTSISLFCQFNHSISRTNTCNC